MRIWHAKLVPILCRQHLLGVWREGLGCYSIIVNDKEGYSKHPAVVEFKNRPQTLYNRLRLIRNEMLKRGYKPKALPEPLLISVNGKIKQWQSLKEQIEILQSKKCNCKI